MAARIEQFNYFYDVLCKIFQILTVSETFTLVDKAIKAKMFPYVWSFKWKYIFKRNISYVLSLGQVIYVPRRSKFFQNGSIYKSLNGIFPPWREKYLLGLC